MDCVYLASEELSQTILLHINNNELFISCPSEDIFNRKCLKFSITENGFLFYFLNKKYNLTKSPKSRKFVFERTDIIHKTACLVSFIEVEKKEFENLNVQLVPLENETYKQEGDYVEFKYSFANITNIKEYVKMEEWLDDSQDDFNKMYLCLEWVNQRVKHKSYMVLPPKRDLRSLLNFADEHGNRLNCRGLAIVLSELCLAAGLYSRYITCSPRERETDDSHVVVIVYSKEFNKWIMLDPSYCLFFSNNQNEPLSIHEFRNLITNERNEVHINENANYHGKRLNINTYLHSIKHKLYRFSSSLEMSIGVDSCYEDNVIHLVPQTKDYNFSRAISNPDIFWQLPFKKGTIHEKHEKNS
ncbi:transglutaminase-like domain-containing protein [Paenibacillus sp. FSL R5-0490]|uniref:transglutaminase-like domain-containing protein n=1 Tax=Paenibacillus sp. FSL R5-0490 TaxID=1920424 RepID=UPI0030CDE410